MPDQTSDPRPLTQSDPEVDEGLLSSLKSLLQGLIGAGKTRLGIFATDWERERDRLVSLAIWGSIFLFVLFLGIVMLSILLVVIFWEEHRVTVLGILTGFFLGATVAIGLFLRFLLRGSTRPFQTTLDELSRDLDRLHR